MLNNLYHVQDPAYPMYVVARDYGEAHRMWEAFMREYRGDSEPDQEVRSPENIKLVCDYGSLLVGERPDAD